MNVLDLHDWLFHSSRLFNNVWSHHKNDLITFCMSKWRTSKWLMRSFLTATSACDIITCFHYAVIFRLTAVVKSEMLLHLVFICSLWAGLHLSKGSCVIFLVVLTVSVSLVWDQLPSLFLIDSLLLQMRLWDSAVESLETFVQCWHLVVDSNMWSYKTIKQPKI